jgi:hypothetical protein
MFIPVIPINRQKHERRTMSKTVFVKAEELAEDLAISKAMAYKLIHQWNEDLRKKGYTTVRGRVSRKYYEEQIYGMGGELHAGV